jgi:hypothetical protein
MPLHFLDFYLSSEEQSLMIQGEKRNQLGNGKIQPCSDINAEISAFHSLV